MTSDQRNNTLFVTDIIRQIFGINSPIYIPWGKEKYYQAKEYSNIQYLPEEIDDAIATSSFGDRIPVVGLIKFDAGEYNIYNKHTGAVEKAGYGDYTLPHSCIVEFSRNTNITKTNVLGSSGTVKEIYGLDDWQITIRGIAMTTRDGNGETAQEQIEALVRWTNICDAIGVESSIFRRKEIYSIAIESFSEYPVVGRWNAVPFQINAISAAPIDLILP